MEDKILENIEKTGFLHELKIGSVLRKRGWSTHHAQTYQDFDAKKSREMDIVATKFHYSKEANFRLEFNLVIDAKKIEDRPWVVFTIKKDLSLGWRLLHNGHNHLIEAENYHFTLLSYDSIAKNNFKNENKRVGIAFHEPFKDSKNETSKIYESLISVCKASWYYADSIYSNEDNVFDPKRSTAIHFYIPVIVLSGKLYDVSLKEDGNADLVKRDYIKTQVNYSSPNYKNDDLEFFPDIIEYSFLEEYLEKTELWVKSMFDEFSETVKDYRKSLNNK